MTERGEGFEQNRHTDWFPHHQRIQGPPGGPGQTGTPGRIQPHHPGAGGISGPGGTQRIKRPSRNRDGLFLFLHSFSSGLLRNAAGVRFVLVLTVRVLTPKVRRARVAFKAVSAPRRTGGKLISKEDGAPKGPVFPSFPFPDSIRGIPPGDPPKADRLGVPAGLPGHLSRAVEALHHGAVTV